MTAYGKKWKLVGRVESLVIFERCQAATANFKGETKRISFQMLKITGLVRRNF